VGGKSVLGHSFIAMDKTKSSEPMKKKARWLTPSKVCEQVVDSNSDESESDTVTAEEEEEEEGCEEVETEPLLQEECAPSHSCYTGCFLLT
jgi:hypothetical protein